MDVCRESLQSWEKSLSSFHSYRSNGPCAPDFSIVLGPGLEIYITPIVLGFSTFPLPLQIWTQYTMSNNISPITPSTAPATATNIEDGKKKNNVDHEEFGDTEMDDLRKVADEQRIEVTPQDVRFNTGFQMQLMI